MWVVGEHGNAALCEGFVIMTKRRNGAAKKHFRRDMHLHGKNAPLFGKLQTTLPTHCIARDAAAARVESLNLASASPSCACHVHGLLLASIAYAK